MIGRAWSRSRPEELALAFEDRQIIDAGLAPLHQAPFIELPELVAVAAMPLAGGIVPFVLESDRDPVITKCPELLDQPLIEFAFPLVGQEPANLAAFRHEFTPISPDRVFTVGMGDSIRVP
jgi:hypothetical protein